MSTFNKVFSIICLLLCLICLVIAIVDLFQFSTSETIVSVQEGGYFDSSEDLLADLHAGYVWKMWFWVCMSLYHVLRLIFCWKECN